MFTRLRREGFKGVNLTNNMHLQKAIEQLGYKPNEAKVYLAALNIGESTLSDIASHTKLPRTSVQVILEALHKKGLMNFYIKSRYKYWTAEDPKKLIDQLDERKTILQSIIPSISRLKQNTESKPIIKVYSGAERIHLIHEDILSEKQDIFGILPWEDWISLMTPEYIDNFIERRVKHFLKGRFLMPKTESTLKLKEREEKELRYVRFLPNHIVIKDALFIYANKVAIISLNPKQPTAVIIDDESTKDMMTTLFEELWEKVEE